MIQTVKSKSDSVTVNFMSAELGHGVPRCLVKHYSGVFLRMFLNETNV